MVGVYVEHYFSGARKIKEAKLRNYILLWCLAAKYTIFMMYCIQHSSCSEVISALQFTNLLDSPTSQIIWIWLKFYDFFFHMQYFLSNTRIHYMQYFLSRNTSCHVTPKNIWLSSSFQTSLKRPWKNLDQGRHPTDFRLKKLVPWLKPGLVGSLGSRSTSP